MKAVGDKIIIKQEIGEEQTTASGLILTQNSAEHQNQGKVLSVGSGILLNDGTRSPLSVKEGDEILFSGGTIVDVKGEGYIFLTESNVLAIL
jgi:chaperonin GroES